MKRNILFIFIVLTSTYIYSVQTLLTLNVTPGKLETLLTKDQKQNTTDLILTGNLNNDDFYFMRDELPNLKNVNLKQTGIDTIPTKAFYNKAMENIILPLNLEYIDEDAFSIETFPNNLSVYVTGKYPGRATYIKLKISEDNNELTINQSGMVFSKDGKSLYDFGEGELCYLFSDGLESIESFAFYKVNFCGYYIFPSSLKEIKTHAFYNWIWNAPVGGGNGNSVVLKSKAPPTLGKDVFTVNNYAGCFLIIPKNCLQAYRDADSQWEVFSDILEGDELLTPPSSNQSTSLSELTVIEEGTYWQFSATQKIKQIDIYTSTGKLIHTKKYHSTTINIPIAQYEPITFAKIIYGNGKTTIIKLNKSIL